MTENVIDYKDIIRKMKSMQYSGWIGLEYIWIAWEQCNQVDTLSETIRLKKVIEAAYAG
jgi:hydroxypyruvate isomerase